MGRGQTARHGSLLRTIKDHAASDCGRSWPDPDEFDKQYLGWLNDKYGTEAAHLDQWHEELKALVVATRQKHYGLVIKKGPAIVAMYPEYVGDANAYELIAAAAKANGDTQAETEMLTSYVHEGGQTPEVLKRLAKLQQAAGQLDESAATLGRLNYVYPFKDDELHQDLGDLLYAQKQYKDAIREYNALVALNPVDKAGAEFNLARAYLASGDRDKAQESVLSALETAPGYRPAQKLLLELQKPSPKAD